MSQFISLPNGDAVSNSIIKSVRYVKDRGVVCSDAQQRLVAWIEVTDVAKGEKVRDILKKFAMETRRGIPQPDWEFLKSEVVAES
jgi:hypothetical protein